MIEGDMSVYIDTADRLHHEQEASLALTCPHCVVFSHISVAAVPRFHDLVRFRPKSIGVVYRCDACNAPIFLRFAAKSYGSQRVELSSQFSEVERPREKFSYTYLPEEVEALFREALLCYSHGAFHAFTTMCRRTAQATFANLGEAGKLRIFDELNEVRDMAELDPSTFGDIKRVLFGNDADAFPSMPMLDERQCGILLEVLKDLLYQAYVRRGRLQQAMMVRRFFSDETGKVKSLRTAEARSGIAEGDTITSRRMPE
jgi:hypothetical protein